MPLTEREEKIVNFMSDLVGTSLERIDNSGKEMIKYNSGILTILTGLATYFKIDTKFLVFPIVFIAIGLLGFIVTIQPIKANYVVGEVNSSIKTYNRMVMRKSLFLKIGYIFTYIGFIWFIFVIIA